LVSAFFIPVIGWWRKGLCYPLVIAALSVSVLSSIFIMQAVVEGGTIHYYLGNWDPPWGIEYVIDHLSAFMGILVSGVSLIIAISSKRSVERELPERIVYFYCLFLLQVTGLLGIVVTGDMFNLYVFLEIASLAGYALIAIGEDGAPFASFNGFCLLYRGSGLEDGAFPPARMAPRCLHLCPFSGERPGRFLGDQGGGIRIDKDYLYGI
jgi:multicomponent Na+:H+ antiporter subunit D